VEKTKRSRFDHFVDVQHNMRLPKKASTMATAGPTTDGTNEKPALVGAGAGACALAMTAMLETTANTTTADLITLLDAIAAWIGFEDLSGMQGAIKQEKASVAIE